MMCYWWLNGKLLLVGKKVMSIVTQIKTNNNLPPKFCYENIVDELLFFFFFNVRKYS